jgi:hypothetical protein
VYSRLARDGNLEMPEKVKQAYLDQVDAGFEYAEKASQELLGYELPQILLIHCNELNSVTLRDSLVRMRKRGYTFVTLEEATMDPAYARADVFAGSGGSWLERSARVMGKRDHVRFPPRVPEWITSLPRPAR